MGSWAHSTKPCPKTSGPGKRLSASSGAVSVAIGTRGEKVTTQMDLTVEFLRAEIQSLKKIEDIAREKYEG